MYFVFVRVLNGGGGVCAWQDADAFYCAVEERDDPTLAGTAFAVGGMSMLTTASYEARKFGVRAAMPGFVAVKLCPTLRIVPLNFDKYKAASARIRAVMSRYDKNYRPLSLDEALMDVTGLSRSS